MLMAKGKLPRFDLVKDKRNDEWALKRGDKVIDRFDKKADATAGGVLKDAVGEGTVRIHKEDGKIQEERTYPRSEDPKGSPG
jgi:hypothetical protein